MHAVAFIDDEQIRYGGQGTAATVPPRQFFAVQHTSSRPSNTRNSHPLQLDASHVLIHAAADTSHGPGTADQRRLNEEGTKAVFSAARIAGIQRAIILSTEAVLADGHPR